MKYTLDLVDRIVLGQLLATIKGPGSYLFHRELRQLRERISFSPEEWEKLGMRIDTEHNVVTWNPETAPLGTIEIEISDRVAAQIKALLITLDKQEKLRDEHVALYEMFVGEDSDAAV